MRHFRITSLTKLKSGIHGEEGDRRPADTALATPPQHSPTIGNVGSVAMGAGFGETVLDSKLTTPFGQIKLLGQMVTTTFPQSTVD